MAKSKKTQKSGTGSKTEFKFNKDQEVVLEKLEMVMKHSVIPDPFSKRFIVLRDSMKKRFILDSTKDEREAKKAEHKTNRKTKLAAQIAKLQEQLKSVD